jgi:hypothetical protein
VFVENIMKNCARLFSAALAFTLLFSACGGPAVKQAADQPASPNGAATTQAGANPAPAQPGTGKPVQVKPDLDTADQVYALVPEKGGEISLTLANGLAFTLTIPEGALLSDQEVTMTPIRSLEGMPFSGGLVAGVTLEPDGTTLLKPATLKIQTPQGTDPKKLLGFGFHGQGEGFYLDNSSVDGTTVTLQIVSFSGHGAGSGTSTDASNQANTPTGSPADDYTQQIADLLAQAKANGGDMPDSSKLVSLLKDEFDKLIYPALQAAANDDTQIDTAGCNFLNWWRNAALLGVESDLQSRIDKGNAAFAKGLKNAFDKASERCVTNQNIDEAGKMLKRLKQIALLGYDANYAPGYTLEGKMSDFQRCGTFKMSFDSLVTWAMDTNMDLTSQVTSTLILKFDRGQGFMNLFRGQGDLEYKSYNIEWKNESAPMNQICNIKTSTSGGTLQAVGRIEWLNLNSKDPKKSTVIAVQPNSVSEKITEWKCTSAAGAGMNLQITPPSYMPGWMAGFSKAHEDIKGKLEDLDPSYLFLDFEYVGGNVVARLAKTYTKTVAGSQLTDDLTMDITAAPGAQ